MAKFIKIPLTGVTGQPEILVDSSSIVSVIAGDVAGPGNTPTLKTRILTNSGVTGYQTLELTHTAALAPASIVGAINAAQLILLRTQIQTLVDKDVNQLLLTQFM
jgi:hypothetical protein